jgi:hypothetical protein
MDIMIDHVAGLGPARDKRKPPSCTITLVSSFAEAVDIDAVSPDFIPSGATNGNSRTTVPSMRSKER